MIKTNVTTEYYIVFLPKHENKQSWNELRLLLKISEIPYLVFRTPDIDYIQVHEINQAEYNYYYYNPN